MKKLLAAFLAFVSGVSFAQFSPNQILTASALNNQFALYLPLTGGTMSGALTVPSLTVTSGLSLSNLAMQAANTVLANATASSAHPIAFTMPSCSSSTSALQWTSGTGFTCYGSSANLAANTFTGNQTVQVNGSPAFLLNDTSGSGQGIVSFRNNNSQIWALVANSTSAIFALNRYNSGSLVDAPVSVSNTTGLVTFADGITANGTNSINGYLSTASAASTYAPLASAALTGTPTAPTASAGTSTTQLATTAFVTASPTINTPTINGVTNGSTAGSGVVGQPVTNSATVSLTSGTAANVTSISVPAGDWWIFGNTEFVPASGTTSVMITSISTTSATNQSAPNRALAQNSSGFPGSNSLAPPIQLVHLSATTTFYLVANGTFTATESANGTITALRFR